MRALTAANSLDLLDQFALPRKLLEVDEALSAVLTQKLLLIATSIDTDDTQTDRVGVLDREMAYRVEPKRSAGRRVDDRVKRRTETATGTGDDEPVARLGVGLQEQEGRSTFASLT